MRTRTFTPENITELRDREIFVFGSNMNGNHAGGAAKVALDKFGAIEGKAIGLQGNSYAIPTLGGDMQKLPIEVIEKHVLEFFKFADKNPQLDFYVTKIGCGIAGFSIEDMQGIFHKIDLTYVFNVALPQEFCVINGFKGYDSDMKCRDMQFVEGKEYHQNGNIKICDNGIHYCENPLDVFRYKHPRDKGVYSYVNGKGNFSVDNAGSKIATSDIKIGGKIDFKFLFDFGFELTFKKWSYLSNLRDKLNGGQDSNTLAGRNYNTLAGRNYNTLAGQDSNTLAGQNYNTLAGQDSNTLAGRNYNTLAGQDCNVVAARYNNTIELNGTSNIAIAANGSKIRGKKGNVIALVEFKNDGIIDYKVGVIDGIVLKEDVFYCLLGGEFVECEG